ncbi:hypothetical protein [Promicromonospora sp. NPDC060271]|uniref:hypothetical protein n=1 Tax=Promicromonospora sp. NPDC060271 TaxID=3347089 RepID=UPI003661F5F5
MKRPSRRPAQAVAVGTIVVAGLLVGGCGSAGTASAGQSGQGDAGQAVTGAPGGCEPQPEVSLCQTYELSGTMTAKDTVVAIPTTGSLTDATESFSCAELASNADGFAFAPLDGEPARIGGEDLPVYFAAEGYAGPGEYELGPGASIGPFVPGLDSSPTIEVEADGSGKITLDSFTSPAPGEEMTGTISWTCVDPG